MSSLHDLTTTEFTGLSPRPRLALIPVGATEQHGPNLAMGVDWRIAQAIATKVAAALSPTVVATPPLPFGLSAHHMGFPGTISIGPDAFRAVLTDVARSLAVHGRRDPSGRSAASSAPGRATVRPAARCRWWPR